MPCWSFIHPSAQKGCSRKLRQTLYLLILTLVRNAAGLTSPALWGKEAV